MLRRPTTWPEVGILCKKSLEALTATAPAISVPPRRLFPLEVRFGGKLPMKWVGLLRVSLLNPPPMMLVFHPNCSC